MDISEDITLQPPNEPALAVQERYRRGYSWAALVFGYFYFRAMRDHLMTRLSLWAIYSVVLSPLLLFFPIWARRRAWAQRDWLDYNEFAIIQKKWDGAAAIGAVLWIIIGYFSYQASTDLVNLLLKTLDPLRPSDQPIDFSQELERIKQNVKDGLGQ